MQMQPNEKFLELFPECRPLPQEQASVRSNTISAGTFIALDSIVREYKLRQLLDDAFGRDAGFILDLAAYMIVSEDNAAQYYPDYARRHPLFTEGMSVKSDSSVSRLLSRMGRDQITAFLDAWNARQDHRHRIYISYDSTNKNSQAGELDLVEFGHPKTDMGLPIFNLSLAFDRTNQIPLFYELYPGSIPDVCQLRYLIEKIVAYNYRSVGVVLDRGYFSRANIEFMDEKKIQFLLMVKGCRSLVSDFVTASRGSFETDRACRVSGADVYGTTIRHKLYDSDKKQRYFHLFSVRRSWLRNEPHLRPVSTPWPQNSLSSKVARSKSMRPSAAISHVTIQAKRRVAESSCLPKKRETSRSRNLNCADTSALSVPKQ